MAQTFDIRFARSAGLAGLFEAPANEFRWKGAGRLSIDAAGISIAVRRGLLTLFARATTRRIPTNDLIEVYREGNALRLEFSTRESPRTVLPIWVGDRESAAQIVTLLPTQRSVELDVGDAGSTRRYQFDRRLVAILLIGIAALGIGALMLLRYFAVDRTVPLVEADSRSSAQTAPQPVPIESPADISATTPGTDVASSESFGGIAATEFDAGNQPKYLRYSIARRELERFQAESSALRAAYLSLGDQPGADDLDALEVRWRNVTSRIYDTENFAGIEFAAQRELELAISRSWRYYFSNHAAGLREGDRRLIELAAAHREFAEALEFRLSQFAP